MVIERAFETLDQYGLGTLPQEELMRIRESVDTVLSHDCSLELSDEFKAELDRRDAEAEAHPELNIPWSKVYAEVMERYKHGT